MTQGLTGLELLARLVVLETVPVVDGRWWLRSPGDDVLPSGPTCPPTPASGSPSLCLGEVVPVPVVAAGRGLLVDRRVLRIVVPLLANILGSGSDGELAGNLCDEASRWVELSSNDLYHQHFKPRASRRSIARESQSFTRVDEAPNQVLMSSDVEYLCGVLICKTRIRDFDKPKLCTSLLSFLKRAFFQLSFYRHFKPQQHDNVGTRLSSSFQAFDEEACKLINSQAVDKPLLCCVQALEPAFFHRSIKPLTKESCRETPTDAFLGIASVACPSEHVSPAFFMSCKCPMVPRSNGGQCHDFQDNAGSCHSKGCVTCLERFHVQNTPRMLPAEKS
ncbi:hypothetical protein BaRGS_00017599 [Batillaria attramentaria]|uniref:Uncharacterized protein n=1 Tax=Batillaria attramentaria TaxID=370345 RepID=A0ABD0KVA7_9CAEN